MQRKCASYNQSILVGGECNECHKNKFLLQRRASSQAETSEVPQIVRELLNSPGRSLDSATRTLPGSSAAAICTNAPSTLSFSWQFHAGCVLHESLHAAMPFMTVDHYYTP